MRTVNRQVSPPQGASMKASNVCFVADESGVTAVEYALIASFISIAIIVPVAQIGTELTRVFNIVATALSSVIP
jgi:pilus assembly protein Flp/PilA